MKTIFLFPFLAIAGSVEGQNPMSGSRISSGVTIKNTQPAPPVTQNSIQKPANSFSTYQKMTIKLPFAKTEKDYFVKKVGHFFVLNGDIIVGNDFPRTRLYSQEDKDYRWPNAIIPYVVDPSIYAAGLDRAVFDAIAEFNGRTKLCLVRRMKQDDYVRITLSKDIKGSGQSEVGRQGGEQMLYLAAGAGRGTVIHEMMHAAGFYHEQCREDRDNYVRVIVENVMDDLDHNFQIEEGVARSAYDYCSIMHYSSTAFSKNMQPTLVCLQNQVPMACPPCMGSMAGFTDADIKGIDWFYSNSSRFPCEPFAQPVVFPFKFPNIYPSASSAAMEVFRHRANIAANEGYPGAFPNFYEARKGIDWVGGTIFLKPGVAEWKDIPLEELGNPSIDDFSARMRATQDYAVRNGYLGGFPTCYQAVKDGKTVCGTVLIYRTAGTEWEDVSHMALGYPDLNDIGAMMRAAHDYAVREGYVGGFPTFYYADYGLGTVCGIILIKESAGQWRDVITVQGPR